MPGTADTWEGLCRTLPHLDSSYRDRTSRVAAQHGTVQCPSSTQDWAGRRAALCSEATACSAVPWPWPAAAAAAAGGLPALGCSSDPAGHGRGWEEGDSGTTLCVAPSGLLPAPNQAATFCTTAVTSMIHTLLQAGTRRCLLSVNCTAHSEAHGGGQTPDSQPPGRAPDLVPSSTPTVLHPPCGFSGGSGPGRGQHQAPCPAYSASLYLPVLDYSSTKDTENPDLFTKY